MLLLSVCPPVLHKQGFSIKTAKAGSTNNAAQQPNDSGFPNLMKFQWGHLQRAHKGWKKIATFDT